MTKPKQIDALIVIALKEEYQGITLHLGVTTTPTQIDRFILHVYTERQSSEADRTYAFWITHDMGPEKILAELKDLIDASNPAIVSNVGIAGMMNGDARIGDVVIAESVDYYGYRGSVSDDPEVLYKIALGGKCFSTHKPTFDAARKVFELNQSLWKQIELRASRTLESIDRKKRTDLEAAKLLHRSVKIHFGPIASGSLVVKSQAFKTLLLARNRNVLCTEMEAAGVATVLHDHFPTKPWLIVKGISDPADSRKNQIDDAMHGANRLLAISTACETLIEVLRRVNHSKSGLDTGLRTAPRDQRTIIEYTVNTFLPKPYRLIRQRSAPVSTNHYQQLSSVLKVVQAEGATYPLQYVIDVLSSSPPQQTSVILLGRPGTGKTSLLSLLYLYLVSVWEQDNSRSFPVMLSMRPSVGFSSDSTQFVADDVQQLEIEKMLDLVEQLHADNNAIKFIILFDSGEAETALVDRLRAAVRSTAACVSGAVVISGRNSKRSLARSGDQVLNLTGFRRNLTEVRPFCVSFLQLLQAPDDTSVLDSLAEHLCETGGDDVDLLDASLAWQVMQKRRSHFGSGSSETIILEEFSRIRLIELGVRPNAIGESLDIAAAFAAKQEQKAVNEHELDELPLPIRAMLRAHPRIHDYLVARHIVASLCHWSGEDPIPEILDCVYPQRINRFAKELIQIPENERAAIPNALKIVMPGAVSGAFSARAFAAYFLGRVKDGQWAQQCRHTLELCLDEARLIHNAATESPDDHQAILFARTVFISLAYLGNKNAAEEYTQLLIENPAFDAVNRGFHLEYYGDQGYDVTLPLQGIDRLHDCPLTYQKLHLRLTSSQDSPLFEIELQTIASLAIHRHGSHKLTKEFRVMIQRLLGDDAVLVRVRINALVNFLSTVKWCLEEPRLLSAGIFSKFSEIKDLPRTGWVNRGLVPVESVAAHVYGCVMIAQFFLRDDERIEGYSKERIIRMLLWHDLAEAIVGDVPSDSKLETDEDAESAVFSRLRYVGIVPNLLNQADVADLYEEFCGASVNAQIAKEIDKLEMLHQIYRFRSKGMEWSSYEADVAYLVKRIRHPVVRRILSQIQGWAVAMKF